MELEILSITINIHLRDTRKYFKGNVFQNFLFICTCKLNLIDNEICTLKINGV